LQGAKRASEFVASSRLLFAALSGCIRDIQTSLRCRSCAPTTCEIGDFSSPRRWAATPAGVAELLQRKPPAVEPNTKDP
jgi:hypothetical protein